MTTPVRLSVVVPTYYRHSALAHLLECLRAQSVAPHEIIVVDQTPQEDIPSGFYEAQSQPGLRVMFQSSPSLSDSRNAGVDAAQGDWIWFLDDDMSFSKTLLETFLRVRERERVDVVYGAVSEQEVLPECYDRDIRKLDPVSIFMKSPNARWSGMVLSVTGANLLIRKETFLRAGGFDRNFPRMEDVELGYRLFRVGAKIWYDAEAFARHMKAPMGGTRKTQQDHLAVKLFSKLYLHHKHFPGWTTRQCLLHMVVRAWTFQDVLTGVRIASPLKNPLFPVRMTLRILAAHRRAARMARTSNT